MQEAILNKINPKKHEVGDVVYYVKEGSGEWTVKFAIVLEHFTSEICLRLIELKDRRCVNGVPYNEYVPSDKWQKLPKGWTYDTKLEPDYEYLEDELKEKYCEIFGHSLFYNDFVRNPEYIKKAYDANIFVNVDDNDHSYLVSEIDKNKGYRIRRAYDGVYHPSYISLPYHKVYTTYEEAEEIVNQQKEELQRIANLSDYEWSVEQIDNTLDKWKHIYGHSDEEKKKYRDRILGMDNIEDVEVRIFAGALQWRYDRNRRWINIEL